LYFSMTLCSELKDGLNNTNNPFKKQSCLSREQPKLLKISASIYC
jgi:hypothetical protein